MVVIWIVAKILEKKDSYTGKRYRDEKNNNVYYCRCYNDGSVYADRLK